MNSVFLETGRLILRRLTEADFSALHGVLSKESVMYAWEHGFSEEESFDFLHRMMRRYETDGYAYFAAIEKGGGAFLGVIGLLAEKIAGEACIGVGYILDDRFWGKGYAAEGAQACLDYAFSVLHAPRIITMQRIWCSDGNRPPYKAVGAYDRPKGSAHNGRDVVSLKKTTKMTVLLHYYRIRNERL